MPEPVLMKLATCVIASEAISTASLTNHSYQYCNLPNCVVLLTPLHEHTTVFFQLILSDIEIIVRGKKVINSLKDFFYFFICIFHMRMYCDGKKFVLDILTDLHVFNSINTKKCFFSYKRTVLLILRAVNANMRESRFFTKVFNLNHVSCSKTKMGNIQRE
jgi:hypothetical protein